MKKIVLFVLMILVSAGFVAAQPAQSCSQVSCEVDQHCIDQGCGYCDGGYCTVSTTCNDIKCNFYGWQGQGGPGASVLEYDSGFFSREVNCSVWSEGECDICGPGLNRPDQYCHFDEDCYPSDSPEYMEYGRCIPLETQETIPEFTTIGIAAIIIAAVAAFFVIKKR